MSDKTNLTIVFAGTPAFGLPSLQALADSKHRLVGIYTQPDKPAGRGLTMQASPVKSWALDHKVPVYQPGNFKSEEVIAELASLAPDLIVVIAYGLILPQAVLSIPHLGCINVHASLLPRWRGASPIQQSILAGDTETGVTIMQMDAGLDTGDILTQEACSLSANETAASLHDKLSLLSINPLLTAIDGLANQRLHGIKQASQDATITTKIKKEQAHINWAQDACVLERQIRAYTPWPIAYTHADDRLLKIYAAFVEPTTFKALPGTVLSVDRNGLVVACGQQALRITRLQFAGGKILEVADWVNSGQAMALLNVVLQ